MINMTRITTIVIIFWKKKLKPDVLYILYMEKLKTFYLFVAETKQNGTSK